MPNMIAYDLGTGGIKASLHRDDGTSLATTFIAYPSFYPKPQWHQQRPMDWWNGVCQSTKELLQKTGAAPESIAALALSGHSLVVAPIDKDGKLLQEQVPIWSDTRAEANLDAFFEQVNYSSWYAATGNGDPPACYSIFKLMWMRENQPEVFEKTSKVLGSKDFINFMLTGNVATDPSYASGTGVFNLAAWQYDDEYIRASGIPKSILPQVMPSHAIVGHVTKQAAAATGLAEGTPVALGGVDNSCMALGALGAPNGEQSRAYVSLGSSCWIAVNCTKPLVEHRLLPFTFAHIEEGYYTSAMSIFAAGSAYGWVKDQLCRDIASENNAFKQMDAWAAKAPLGSGGVLFNPSLAGGSTQEKSQYIQGAFLGLNLATTREEMVRACLEGITMNLRLLLDEMEKQTPIGGSILLCGGGSKSAFWRSLFADIFNKTILKTNVDQDTAVLGAAGIAARACGLWKDYTPIAAVHHTQSTEVPRPENAAAYQALLPHFNRARDFLAELGDSMHRDE